jgi:hypothetical protein
MHTSPAKKAGFVAMAATAILAASVATAFAAPVLPAGTTSGPHNGRGTCSDCHTYAAPVVKPPAPAPAPVVTPPAPAPAPVVTPPAPAPAPAPAPVVTPPVVAPAPVVTPPVVAPVPAPVFTPTAGEDNDRDGDRSDAPRTHRRHHRGDARRYGRD